MGARWISIIIVPVFSEHHWFTGKRSLLSTSVMSSIRAVEETLIAGYTEKITRAPPPLPLQVIMKSLPKFPQCITHTHKWTSVQYSVKNTSKTSSISYSYCIRPSNLCKYWEFSKNLTEYQTIREHVQNRSFAHKRRKWWRQVTGCLGCGLNKNRCNCGTWTDLVI